MAQYSEFSSGVDTGWRTGSVRTEQSRAGRVVNRQSCVIGGGTGAGVYSGCVGGWSANIYQGFCGEIFSCDYRIFRRGVGIAGAGDESCAIAGCRDVVKDFDRKARQGRGAKLAKG